MNLSLSPYKGTRDFYPKDKALQNYIFDIMRGTVESFGYEEYDTPLLEDTDLYKAKSGEEIVNEQTYSFVDRGGRQVTIRPELTPSLARMIAAKRKELRFPLRWYSIPNLYRYERPQKNRLREHWQLNVDLLGIDTIFAEFEIFLVIYKLMENFCVKTELYQIKVNNRKLVNYFFYDYLKLKTDVGYKLMKILDRKDKVKRNVFEKDLKLLLKSKYIDFQKVFSQIEKGGLKFIKDIFNDCEGYSEIIDLFNLLKQINLDKNIVFDFSLMRGLDYYTGIVFEVFDNSSKNKRALAGGGRYDDLVGMFNVDSVSAVGFGMGDVGLQKFLKDNDLLPEVDCSVDLYICVLDKKFIPFAHNFANKIREQGFVVEVDLTGRKLQKQISFANKKNIPFIICYGEDEYKDKIYNLKFLPSGEVFKCDLENLLLILNTKLNIDFV